MLEFSASADCKNKVAYKNYRRVEVETFAELGELGRTHSLTSLFFGPGVTEGGEQCEGHRAWASSVGAGNVLFMDFDNKGATLDDVVGGFVRVGAGGWVGPSKSCDIGAGVFKFHAAVAFDQPVPHDKEAFEQLYRATMQFMGFEAWYDPCMHGVTQQIAPHWKTDGPNEVIDGGVLDMAEVFASYVPPEEQSSNESGGGFAGEVPADTLFTLSKDGTKVSVKDMLAMVAGGRKVRVHCLAGLKHDGRDDTALVRGDDAGDESLAYYHCTGGRCGHTLVLRDPEPFEVDESGEEEEGGAEGFDSTSETDVWQLSKKAPVILTEAPYHAAAFMAKAKDKQREQAVAWVCQRIFELADVRQVEGSLRWFDGVKWAILFENDNEMVRWVQSVFVAVGLKAMAYNVAAVGNVVTLLRRTVRICEAPAGGVGNVVNLGNGMLDLRTMTLLPHDREQLFCSVLPFDYDAAAVCPEWDAFVHRIMLGSDRLKLALQDAVGYLFARALHLEVMIGLVGEGANGKSTLIDVIAALVGETGASHIPLQSITKASGDGLYARVGLSGRMVNFTSELSPRTLEATEFKNLITGKNILARDPFGKAFTLSVVPKQVCAMNSTDHLVKEKTHGFMRRLHLIPFKYTVPLEKRDLKLLDKLLAELPGILNWALAGTRRVLATGKLSSSVEMTNLLEQIKLDSNPVQQFLEERTATHSVAMDEVQPRNKLETMVVGVSELYEKYVEFCTHNTYRPLGRNAFSKECERLGVTKVDITVKLDGVAVKASGFYVKLLKPNEWNEPGYKPKLVLVT